MAASKSVTDVPPDRTIIIVSVGVIVALIAAVFGLPGAFVLALVFTFAGFRAQYPQLTGGTKNAPTPNSDYERMEITKFRRRSEWKTAILVPSSDWGTWWPIRGSFATAILAAAIAACLPVIGGWWPLAVLNAYGAFGIVAGYSGSRRRNRFPEENVDPMVFGKLLFTDVVPGIGLRRLWEKLLPGQATIVASVLAGLFAIASGFAGYVAADALRIIATDIFDQVRLAREVVGHGIDIIVATVADVADFTTEFSAEQVMSESGPILPFIIALAALAGLSASLPFVLSWRAKTLEPFVIRHGARIEWRPGWESVLKDKIPKIIERKTIDDRLTIDTFAVPAGMVIGDFLDKEAKFGPAVPGGRSIAIADMPQLDSSGQPIPGSQHQSRFQVVQWETENKPDINDPSLSLELVTAYMNAIAGPAARKAAVAVPVRFDSIIPLHAEDSPYAAYQAVCSSLSPDLHQFMRDAASGEPFGTMFNTPLVINHRPNKDGGLAFYFGNATAPDFVPNDDAVADLGIARKPKSMMDVVGELASEDEWTGLWASTDVISVGKLPVIQHPAKRMAKLADGTEIIRQGFLLRQGQDYHDLFGVENRFRATSMRTPFASVTGFPADKREREGERRDGAINFTYCPVKSSDGKPQQSANIPVGPVTLVGESATGPRSNMAQTWVLAGRINEAFDSIRLARPEVISARPLTAPDSRHGHIWEVKLRLYGSVTYDDIRNKSKKLRELLGDVPWFRVAYSKQAAYLYMGADPSEVELRDENRDRARVVELDWSETFNSAKLVGNDGSLPHMQRTEVMPDNDQVRKIEFNLPAGLSVDRVKGAVTKLTTASGMGYIEVYKTADPSEFGLVVSKRDPMPTSVGYDFDRPVVDECLNFAVSVEGSSVFYDPSDSPHIMFIGTTGSGKTATAQNIAYGAIVAGWDVLFVDVQKGAADFKFAEDRALSVATSLDDARAALEYAYAEVRRRVRLNSEHGTSKISELPDEVQPRRMFVFIDEFNGLVDAGRRPSKTVETDPDLERARIEATEEYENRTRIAELSNKIGAEARSAGVHLVVMGQKFTSDVMDKAKALKTNSARLLQGKTSYGDRASALRSPETAPDLGEEVPKGRAIWESVSQPVIALQTRFATAGEYSQHLVEAAESLHPIEKVDLAQYRPAKRQVLVEGDEIDLGEPISDGMADLSFDDAPDDDDDTGITVSDDGSLDLSAFLGGGGDSDDGEDDGPGLDFGDEEPELVFGDDSSESETVGDDPFASVDEASEEVMPEFDFDAAIAAEEAESGEPEPAEEVIHTPVDEPVDDAVDDEPELVFDDESADEDEDPQGEPEPDETDGDALSGDVIVIDAQALTVIQALPGATVSIGQGKSRTHVFTEAIDKLIDTGATVVVTASGGVEDIIAEATDADLDYSDITFDHVEDIAIEPGSTVTLIGLDLPKREIGELKEMFSDCQATIISASARAGVSMMQLNRVLAHHDRASLSEK